MIGHGSGKVFQGARDRWVCFTVQHLLAFQRFAQILLGVRRASFSCEQGAQTVERVGERFAWLCRSFGKADSMRMASRYAFWPAS